MHDEKHDEKLRKLFVGGLKDTTDDQTFRDYFSTFGTLTDCAVVKDPTGRSRKFGFVTFETSEMVDIVQAQRPHKIDGKDVETKRPAPKNDPTPNAQAKTQKLFVGGLMKNLSEQDITDYFSAFGNVQNVDVIKHKDTGASRGFAFVLFDDHDTVDKIYLIGNHHIKDNRIDTRKAVPKDEMRRNQGSAADYQSNRNFYVPNSFNPYEQNQYYQYQDQGWAGYVFPQWANEGGWNPGWNQDYYGYVGGMGDNGAAAFPSAGQDRVRYSSGGRGGGRGRGRGGRGMRRPH